MNEIFYFNSATQNLYEILVPKETGCPSQAKSEPPFENVWSKNSVIYSVSVILLPHSPTVNLSLNDKFILAFKRLYLGDTHDKFPHSQASLG